MIYDDLYFSGYTPMTQETSTDQLAFEELTKEMTNFSRSSASDRNDGGELIDTLSELMLSPMAHVTLI